MNPLSFAAKRAHLDLVQMNRELLAPMGITPARLDMMQAIRARFDGCQMVGQLAAFLGVSRQVVSRMAKALEALGLVARERTDVDRRCVYLILTERGVALLAEIRRIYLLTGLAGRAALFALRDTLTSSEQGRRFIEMAKQIRTSFDTWAPFEPETEPVERWDDGAALEGREQRIFTHACRWLYGRCHRLPFLYLMDNTPLRPHERSGQPSFGGTGPAEVVSREE